MDLMSTTSVESVEAGRARLVAAMATMGTKAGAEHIFRQVWDNAPPGMCMGTRAPEPVYTLTEQLDRMCARVAARKAAEVPA